MRFLASFLLGALVGAASYLVLLVLHGWWEEAIAGALIGAVAGTAGRSAYRIALAAAACCAGWFAGTIVFSVWVELGIGAWLGAGAALGLAMAGRHRWWVAILATLTGLLAGGVAEAVRYLPVFVEGLRGVDMQFLLLVSAGVLLISTATLFAQRGRAHDRP